MLRRRHKGDSHIGGIEQVETPLTEPDQMDPENTSIVTFRTQSFGGFVCSQNLFDPTNQWDVDGT